MDSNRLAESSVNLNLQLMRWRALPTLDLATIRQTKCLLLGAGTLGCAVARNLLAWGVQTITFVDNGKVSFSNPVRQSLYTHDDCLNGGAPKAEAAAKNLKKIHPGVNSVGYNFSIPMPGHFVSKDDFKAVVKDIELLCTLIDDHNVIFLLTDSRESRWLPTLLCAAKNKCAMNVALGFDSFVVMRHGDNYSLPNKTETKEPSSSSSSSSSLRLGCYFCNDVVGPTDSLSDRTLDQQCTVTRPGLSGLSSSLAVELLIALLHHPQKQKAGNDQSTALGIIPHQMRGFLSDFGVRLLFGQAFDKCTACSNPILNAYMSSGNEFLFEAFNKPSYLEDLSGLTQLKRDTENVSVDWESDPTAQDDF